MMRWVEWANVLRSAVSRPFSINLPPGAEPFMVGLASIRFIASSITYANIIFTLIRAAF